MTGIERDGGHMPAGGPLEDQAGRLRVEAWTWFLKKGEMAFPPREDI